jgi:hypothetical protein
MFYSVPTVKANVKSNSKIHGKSNIEWLDKLQKEANKCWWLLSLAYPWDSPTTPKNMKGNLLIMEDGFPIIRFKVLNEGKSFKMLQCHFKDFKGKLHETGRGQLYVGLMKFWWKKPTDEIEYWRMEYFIKLIVESANEKWKHIG